MDKYDEHIERLVEKPEALEGDWTNGAALFRFCGNFDDTSAFLALVGRLGCLTMIRESKRYVASDPALTACVRSDKRIHRGGKRMHAAFMAADSDTKRELLSVYADYQRDMDDTIRKGLPWKANRSKLPEHAAS